MINWLRQLFFDEFVLGAIRSPKWSEVRKEFITLNPLCVACGKKGNLLKVNEVHHIVPFSINPALELEPSNLITLCRPHHYLFGHLESWRSYNANVLQDVAIWSEKINTRP